MAEQQNFGGHYFHSDPEVVPGNAPERVPHSEKFLLQDHKQLPSQPRHRICGLRPLLFWLLILAMVVMLAGAIGGGVGGGLAAQHSRYGKAIPGVISNGSFHQKPPRLTVMSSPPSSAARQSGVSTSTSTMPTAGATTSSATSSGASATPTYQFFSGCPATNGSIYTPINVQASNSTYQVNGTDLNYLILCDTNFADSVSGFNPGISDLQVLYNVSSLDDCITHCASYNFALTTITNPPWSLLCSGVAYAVPEATSSDAVKCFLKSGVRNNAVNVQVSGEEDSAVLQWVGES